MISTCRVVYVYSLLIGPGLRREVAMKSRERIVVHFANPMEWMRMYVDDSWRMRRRK
jgi:hypothetical protein